MVTQQQSPSPNWVQSSFSLPGEHHSEFIDFFRGRWSPEWAHTDGTYLLSPAACVRVRPRSCPLRAPVWSPFSFFIPLLLCLPALPVLEAQRGCGEQALRVPSCSCWLQPWAAGATLHVLHKFTAAHCASLKMLTSCFSDRFCNVHIPTMLRLMLTLLLTLEIQISWSGSANVSIQGPKLSKLTAATLEHPDC